MKKSRLAFLGAFCIIGLLLAWSPNRVHAKTLSGLQSDVRLLIHDEYGTSRVKYASSTLTGLINQGQRYAVSKTWCIIKSTDISLVANTTYYSLPTDFINTYRVTHKDGREVLEQATIWKLDTDSDGWETDDTTENPDYYFFNPANRTEIGVKPFTTLSSDTLHILYYAQADDLSASTDVPFEGIREYYPYHDMLAYYAASLLAKVKYGDTSQRAKDYMDMFQIFLYELDEKSKLLPDYHPSFQGRNQ